jgi:hypothetical protein
MAFPFKIFEWRFFVRQLFLHKPQAAAMQKRTADERGWTQIPRRKKAGFSTLFPVSVRRPHPDTKKGFVGPVLSAFIRVHLRFQLHRSGEASPAAKWPRFGAKSLWRKRRELFYLH